MPRHLELVCAGLEIQTFTDMEVFICDDGSGKETAEVIEKFKSRAKFPVRHLWQEDQGMRKCRILNEALRQASGEIAVFLDGDCVPHSRFIEDHVSHTEAGCFLAGRRVEVGPRLAARLNPEMVRSGFFDWPRPEFLWSVLRGDSEYLNRTFRVANGQLRKWLKMDHVVDLKGCNYSVERSVLEDLNGFDEAYEGYGREDTDIELRMRNYGLKIKSLKGLALQYHIWHPRQEWTPGNEDRLEEVKRTRRVRCEKGLNSTSAPTPVTGPAGS